MTKAITNLKLANKVGNIFRLSGSTYTELSTEHPLRYESIAPVTSPRDTNNAGKEKAFLLAHHMMIDDIDLKISDRVLVTEDDKIFVVCGIQKFQENEICHLEVLIREVFSELHETVQLLTLGTNQPNFDPIFKSWASEKTYQETEVQALVDRLDPGSFPDLQAAGRISDAEFVVTFDLPIDLTVKDKVKIRGEEYFISRIEDFPYQIMCVVSKVVPSGRQF